MAGLAYVFLPVTGLFAYLKGATERVRFHGLQAILLGVVWPAALYAGSWISPRAVQASFLGGAVLWIVFTVAAAAGRDPSFPGLKGVLARAARESPLAGRGTAKR